MGDQGGDKTEKPAEEVKRRGSIELTKIEVKPSAPVRDSNTSDQAAKATFPRPEVIYAPEKIGNYMSCLKYALFVFNALIWLVGLAITGVSIWLLVDPNFWTFQLNLDMTQFKTGAQVGIAVGVFILMVGFVGCCGAIKESICLLTTYFAIGVVLVMLEAAAMGIVWSALNNRDTQDKIASLIRKGIGKREDNPASLYFIDLLQTKLQCCGMKNSDEYEEKIPTTCMDPNTGFLYETGCVEKVMNYLKSKAALLGGVAITALLLQIGALVVTICLVCGIRQSSKEIF